MAKIWQPTEAADFAHWAARNPRVTVFTLIGPTTYSAYTANPQRSRISGEATFGHLTATALCRSFGPIHQQPPDGTRDGSTLYSRLNYHP